MPTRRASAAWEGGLKTGKGTLKTETGAASGAYSFTSRFESGTGTNPEELLAASYAPCFAMALSNEVAQAGGTPQALDVQADVSLGPDPAGGFKLTGIKLTVRGEVDGLTAEQFAEQAQAAKAGCPVSKALTGVDITLDAALEE